MASSAFHPPGWRWSPWPFAAFVAYGKGSGRPAGLNFGDVFSYALAKVRGLPLLFKGDDFSRTDIVGVPCSDD
ncbi:type II toxin-antitoxin system VapC family toxin [Thiohalocapsa sp. ML1]|uniref:type II toxin-antitoxin system VapC family toxin n=1 Tax=Thiohalocapsa sp. ML1 TaxID=1431688 RepID=UPI0009E73741|nr:type II toxin-antitoxin system VapC family toxin [Thiohalocapsa sp. ML1]